MPYLFRCYSSPQRALSRRGFASALLLALTFVLYAASSGAQAANAAGLTVTKLVSSPSTVVNGTGATATLVLSAPATPGTDPYGNPENGVTVVVTGLQSNLFTFLSTQNADGSSTTTDSAGDTAYVFIPTGDITGTVQYTANVVSSTVTATMNAALNAGSATAKVTVVPTLPAGITITPNPVYNGNTVSVTVTLQTPAYEYIYSSNGQTYDDPGASVTISTSNLAAYFPNSYTYDPDGSILYSYYNSPTATLIIPQGQTTATFMMSTNPVTADQNATISALDNGKTVASVITITPSLLSSIVVNPSPVVTGGTAEGTVTLSEPADGYYYNGQLYPGAQVTVTSSDPTLTFGTPYQTYTNADGSSYYVGYNGQTAYLTIPQGSEIGTFALSAGMNTANTTVAVTATLNSSQETADVTVITTRIATNRGNSSKIYNGNSATGTITLSSPAPTTTSVNNQYVKGVDVLLNSSDPSTNFGQPYSSTYNPDGSIVYVGFDGNAMLYIPAGNTSGTYTLYTTSVAQNTTSTVTASLGGVNVSRLVTVTPTLLSTMVSSLHTVHSNQQAILTVVLTGPAVSYQQPSVYGGTTTQPGVLINLTSSVPGVLFQSYNNSTVTPTGPGTATLYIPAGATSASYAVSSNYATLPANATITASLYASQRVINLILKQ